MMWHVQCSSNVTPLNIMRWFLEQCYTLDLRLQRLPVKYSCTSWSFKWYHIFIWSFMKINCYIHLQTRKLQHVLKFSCRCQITNVYWEIVHLNSHCWIDINYSKLQQVVVSINHICNSWFPCKIVLCEFCYNKTLKQELFYFID